MGTELIPTAVQGGFAVTILIVVFKYIARRDRQVMDLFKMLQESIKLLHLTTHDCREISAQIVGHQDLSRMLKARSERREDRDKKEAE